MLRFIRHISKMMTLVLMVLFFAVLIADEYYDTLRAIDDLRISSAKQSDKQLRGLVRHHAPRKGIVRTNYIWT